MYEMWRFAVSADELAITKNLTPLQVSGDFANDLHHRCDFTLCLVQ